MSERVTWKEAYNAATRIMEGSQAILDAVLQNGGGKALQAAAMAHSMDAVKIMYYLSLHDSACEDKRTVKEVRHD